MSFCKYIHYQVSKYASLTYHFGPDLNIKIVINRPRFAPFAS